MTTRADATLRLRTPLHECAFDTHESVRDAAERARVTRMAEADEEVKGMLLGVLPRSRRFEYRIEETGDIIIGRIAEDIEDPQALHSYVEKPSIARLWVVTLERGGNERRTYDLYTIELDERNAATR